MKKNNGKQFEVNFKESMPEHVWTYRPPDIGGGRLARFTQESICDLMAYNSHTKEMFLFELKSSVGTSFSYPRYEECEAYEQLKVSTDLRISSMGAKERKLHSEANKKARQEVKLAYKSLNKNMIKYHQIMSLQESQERYGIESYIVFTFLSKDATYLVPIDVFVNYWKTATKKSINEQDLIELGVTRLEQEFIGRSAKKIKYNLKFIEGGSYDETDRES